MSTALRLAGSRSRARMMESSRQQASTMPREALRPYRYGMTLLCFGGLLNWLGLFENYAEPVRYVGVACVVSGAMLLCFAICCWIRPGARARRNEEAARAQQQQGAWQTDDPVHVIAVGVRSASLSIAAQKPPDYETVTDKPPSYDDAIKLSPALLWLADEQERQARQLEHPDPDPDRRGQGDAVMPDKEVAGREPCQTDGMAAHAGSEPRQEGQGEGTQVVQQSTSAS